MKPKNMDLEIRFEGEHRQMRPLVGYEEQAKVYSPDGWIYVLRSKEDDVVVHGLTMEEAWNKLCAVVRKVRAPLKYKGFCGDFQRDEDGRLHGEVIGIADTITFQAFAESDIEEAFKESVDDYLAFVKSRGTRRSRK